MTRWLQSLTKFGGLLVLIGTTSLVFGQTPPANAGNDDVRNIFLKGRESYEAPPASEPVPNLAPASMPKSTTPTRKRSMTFEPNAEIVKRESKKDEPANTRKTSSTTPAPPPPSRIQLPLPNQNLALGYTLFKRETDGQWMRVDPSQTFREGDSVRFTLETSVPGYLYVLLRKADDGTATLLFPNPQLAKGNNYLEAHRLQEMPASQSTAEQWFTIEGGAGAETLLFVVSRKPLPMIPAREMLVAYCQDEPTECTKLKPFIWNWLVARQNRPTLTMTNPAYGQKLLPDEVTSIKHGARLKLKAPLPAVMTMLANKSSDPDEDLIVTKVTLTHK
ncbi:MAG: DUF4384 domain-containing protein [Blastocatellia bacterium]|nr:DUF4384 domain-containing protein [Blastocatellia bacterium]